MRLAESQVQQLIKDALELAGLTVYHTSAFKQKGGSGVSKGIPDLLVVHPQISCCFIGIEVKRPGKVVWSSGEQEAAHQYGHFHLAQSPKEALEAVRKSLLYGETLGQWQTKISNVLRGLGA